MTWDTLIGPFRSQPTIGRELEMAFTYRLENEDGTPADPPVLHTAVPNWGAGDTITLGRDNALRVIETRFTEEDSVLVVEPASA
jgi:hypothetical protein